MAGELHPCACCGSERHPANLVRVDHPATLDALGLPGPAQVCRDGRSHGEATARQVVLPDGLARP